MAQKLVLVGIRNVLTHVEGLKENQPEKWRALFSDLHENGNKIVLATSIGMTDYDKVVSGLDESDFDDVYEDAIKTYPQGLKMIAAHYNVDIRDMFMIDGVFKSVMTMKECGGNGIEFTTIEDARAALQKNGNLRAPE